MTQANNFRITTPHAAIIVWNYDDRIGVEGASNSTINRVSETIISTVSCLSIQTSKSKSIPNGSFQLVLAPTKNWVSEITAGSWCAIMMSNQPITDVQLKKADKNFVKMIGKIESVKVDVAVGNDGARHTQYVVTGSDWGHIFNSVIYIDNLIAGANDPKNQGNTIAIMLQNMLVGDGNSPKSFKVDDNLISLMHLFGESSVGINTVGKAIGRLGKSVYDFNIPAEMAKYFNFLDADGDVNPSIKISDILALQTGRLTRVDEYEDTDEAFGYIDPFSMQGTNSLWQILNDNSNPALNEMYNEISWDQGNNGQIGPSLTIYNRIKPFAFRNDLHPSDRVSRIRSLFKYVRYHNIDSVMVKTVSASTNWRDKFNFVEIRPQFQDFKILANWVAQKSQGFDEIAFNREGFRPLIIGTKQFPVDPNKANSPDFNPDYLTAWIDLLKEWYFDTHKLLNGTLSIEGGSEYIAVGNNVMFEAGLINPTINMNRGAVDSRNTVYVLAHVENVEHTFSIADDARTYNTNIQFVRGILVDSSRNPVGSGSLDEFASKLKGSYNNKVNTFGTSDSVDPDPQKLKGT